MSDYDLIIRGGRIVDGSGSEPFVGDVAIKDGTICEVSPKVEGSSDHEVDASGKTVTPGFVDVHTHYDGQATWDNHLNPSSALGTTTVIAGNCGVGFAPCKPQDREVLVQLMEGVEEIPGSALAAGIPWNWESFPEYMDALDEKPRDIDLAVFLPHGPLRVYVMGKRGVNREEASQEDLESMKQIAREGLAAGAVGISSSRTLLHLSSTGDNVPTYEAATREMKELGSCLSGEQGQVLQFISDFAEAEQEFDILRETSLQTGAKGTFTLIATDNPLGEVTESSEVWRQHLVRIEEAQSKGLDIRGQVISRPIGILMGHPATMSPFYRRPTFMACQQLPHEEIMVKLRDPLIKAKILAEENENPHIFVQLLSDNFSNMYPMEDPIDYLPASERNVAEQAKRANQSPIDWLYDFLLGNDGSNLIYIPATSKSKSVISELLRHPHTIEALGDGGAHVGSICDTSANLFLLTKWVKDEGVFSLAEGVRMLTSEPANFFSLNDRGLLKNGMKADFNIIDIDNLKLMTPRIVHDLPGGGSRFLQDATGIEATFVRGQQIYSMGEPTGILPGKLLRGAQQSPR